MNGKPSVVNVICLVAEKVEELGIHDCYDEIEGVIGIGNDDEQCRLPVSDGVQLHLIVAHQLPQLCDVEGRKPCTAGNQNRLGGFARDEKSRTFSSNSQTSYILLNLVAKQSLDFVLHRLSGVLVEVDTDNIGRAVYLLSDGGCGVLCGGLCCCVSVFCHSIPPMNEKCPTRKG